MTDIREALETQMYYYVITGLQYNEMIDEIDCEVNVTHIDGPYAGGLIVKIKWPTLNTINVNTHSTDGDFNNTDLILAGAIVAGFVQQTYDEECAGDSPGCVAEFVVDIVL